MKRIFCIFLTSLLLTSCDERKEVVLSPEFKVCARLDPNQETYGLNESKKVDWDDGVLRTKDANYDVYIGRHPDFNFPKDLKMKSDAGNFFVAGQGAHAGEKKILLAKKLSEDWGDFLYVMFEGNFSDSDLARFSQKDFVHSCK